MTLSNNARAGLIFRSIHALIICSLLAALLYFALRNAPLVDIWKTLSKLRLWKILVLLGIDGVIYLFITLRSWWIVHAENKRDSYFPLLAIIMTVFCVPHCSIGPQV